MENFKIFFESKLAEEDKNIKATLRKIPKSHQLLIQGYKYEFQQGNTLKNDDKYVGCIDDKNKKITIAAPWNFGREFTFLHEIAHKIWDRLPKEKQSNWKKLAKNNTYKESMVELFCMIYANYYVKNPIVKYENKELYNFIKGL